MSLTEVIIRLVLLFPITTLFQNYVSFSNTALLILTLVALVVKIVFSVKVSQKLLIYVLFSFVIWGVAIVNTSMAALRTNVNMAIYYIFMIVYFVFCINEKESAWIALNHCKNYIFTVVCVYTMVLTVSIILPSSYTQMTAGGWGNEKYFVSFSGSPNRVGPACLFILTLMIFLIKKKYDRRIIYMLTIPHLYTVAMGGSRTYFILGACTILIIFYYGLRNKRNFIYIIPFLIFLFVLLVLRSNMLNKIIATFQYSSNRIVFWQRLTNTRSIFWLEQLKMFWETTRLHHFIGNGINFTTYNYGLWAHSDFIEILCSYGYIGLLNYIFLMVMLLKTFLTKYKANRLIKFTVFFIWFFNAFFNFFYCYFCAMLSYPILLMIVNEQQMENRSMKALFDISKRYR